MQPIVLKISGHELSDDGYLSTFASVIHDLQQPVVIVHGGGKDITAVQERFGIMPRFVEGIRVTDTESLTVVEMVLCGLINKRMVRFLQNGGVKAMGISGVDGGLVRARPMVAPVDMGYTGEIVSVDPMPLNVLLEAGFTPVVAPISLGDTTNLNVNADHVAGAIARTIHAQRVVFISNVAGVLQDGVVLPRLSVAQAQVLIASGVITGGMIPKVQTALESLANGVSEAVITHLDGLKNNTGTTFIKE